MNAIRKYFKCLFTIDLQVNCYEGRHRASKEGLDLESVMLSEVSQTEKGKYRVTSLVCGMKRDDTNGLVYKTEAHRLRERTSGCPGGRMGGGTVRECGMDMHTRLYSKCRS